MIKQRTPPDILLELIGRMVFKIEYQTTTDNNDGTYTLGGICDIHHAQPGFGITIGASQFKIKDYAASGSNWTLTLIKKTGGTLPALPAAPGSFDLYPPFFFHGTPTQQEIELKKIPSLADKTPMIFLMEPYKILHDHSESTSVDRKCTMTFCFLTQAVFAKWLTKDFYHNAIDPMYKLYQDFMDMLKESDDLIYSVNQKSEVAFHAKFGINVKVAGTNETCFSQDLSGVSVNLELELYKDFSCCQEGRNIMSDPGQFLEVS